jgi:tRNA(Leu) C34 or U34 (ribose-2'-O)-methylase TrmL
MVSSSGDKNPVTTIFGSEDGTSTSEIIDSQDVTTIMIPIAKSKDIMSFFMMIRI